MAKKQKIGATGQFPKGKIDDSDEGELKIGISVTNGNVIISFGKVVAWIGMDKETANNIGNAILERAKTL